jgi:hypothetical protein
MPQSLRRALHCQQSKAPIPYYAICDPPKFCTTFSVPSFILHVLFHSGLWPQLPCHIRLLMYFHVFEPVLIPHSSSRKLLPSNLYLSKFSSSFKAWLKGYLFLKPCLIPQVGINPSFLWASMVLGLYFSYDTYTRP